MSRHPSLTLITVITFLTTFGALSIGAEGVFANTTVRMPPRQVVGRRADAKIVIMSMRRSFPEQSLRDVETRVAAELSTIGLKVVSVPAKATDLNGQLSEMRGQANAHHALGSIRVFRGQGHARVVHAWIYDAITRKRVFRRLLLQPERGPDAAAAVALQVVELLHASLIEIRMSHQRKKARRRAPPIVHRMVASRLDPPPAPRPGPWAIAAGAWNSWSLDQGGVAGGLTLGLSYRPLRWLSFFARSSAPLVSSRIGDHRGLARITIFTFRGGVWLEPFAESRFSPGVAIGAGSFVAGADGDARPPYRQQSEWTAVALLSVDARLAVRVSQAVRLLAIAGVDVTLPEVTISFETDTIARLGRPLLSGSVAVEWRWGRR